MQRTGATATMMCALVVSVSCTSSPSSTVELKKALAGESVESIRNPMVAAEVAPTYPESALRAGIVGTVIVKGIPNPQGRLDQLRVVGSVDPSLDAAALKCVSQWRIALGTDSTANASWLVIPVRFSFGDSLNGQRRLRKQFDKHLASIKALGVRVPTQTDAALRQTIIRESYELETYPAIPTEAIVELRQVQELLKDIPARRDPNEARRRANEILKTASEIVYSVPWLEDGYKALAVALEVLKRPDEAALNLEIYTAGESSTAALEETQARIDSLRSNRQTLGH